LTPAFNPEFTQVPRLPYCSTTSILLQNHCLKPGIIFHPVDAATPPLPALLITKLN